MSVRYLCPNDAEVMNVEPIPSVTAAGGDMTEQYRCPFCHYHKDKATVISTHKSVDESYIPPSKRKH